MDIEIKFRKDKENLIFVAKKYIADFPLCPKTSVDSYRTKAYELIASQEKAKISEAMRCLETARDARCGIALSKIFIENGAPILIRDARNAKEIRRGSEAFEIQYLNIIRTALDIADIESKPDLKEKIFAQLKTFQKRFPVKTFSKNLDKRIAEERMVAKKLRGEIDEIVLILKQAGIANALTKLSVGKDFQNLENKNYNVITLSEITDESGAKHTAIEGEVALRGLTDKQKQEYKNLDKAPWFLALPEWQKKLCRKYAIEIVGSEHVMPTQLWQLPGMRNAFEKITGIIDGGELKIVHEAKHCGTLASFSKDKNSRKEIAKLNLEQLEEWLGNGIEPHINSLNSAGILGKSHDPEIVKQLEKLNIKHTNTALNLSRISGSSSILKGADKLLAQITKSLTRFPQTKIIQENLKPRNGLFRNIRRAVSNFFNSPEKAIKELEASKKISHEDAKILNEALNLRKNSDEISAFVAKGNPSIRASSHLALLTRMIRIANDSKLDLPKEEIAVMCAHGKDRTGMAMHDQSAQALSFALRVDVKKIDAALIAAGHTAQQSGGTYSCGSASGCFGIRNDNGLNIGSSSIAATRGLLSSLKFARHGREKNLVDLIEYASHGTLSKASENEKELEKSYLHNSRAVIPLQSQRLQKAESQLSVS